MTGRRREAAAAPGDRRVGRRRQVDPDRAAAARRQADPAGHARRAAPQRHGRRAGPRLDHRRPARRARAGHHDRRRLPLLHDAAALVHHRRHPGPRALHAQHGHGRLDRAPRGDPDRRAPRDHRAVAPPRLPLVAARHPPHGRGGQQDGPRRLGREPLPRDRERVHVAGRAARRARTPARSRSRRSTATTSSSAATADWYDGPPLLEHLEAVDVAGERGAGPLRLPVQWVIRPEDGARGERRYAGQVAGGTLRAGRRGRRAAGRLAHDGHRPSRRTTGRWSRPRRRTR